MTTIELETPPAESRTKRLKAATHAAHESLDAGIMAYEPFSSRERYSSFLRLQYAFHRDIDALFSDPVLAALLPELDGRRRLALIKLDLADLGQEISAAKKTPAFIDGADLPEALGWLYVAEGSNLGAAFLLKAAAGLGLSEAFGARHLAGAPEGRGLHWRTFTAALDGVELSAEQERTAIAGAQAAFRRVRDLLLESFG